jgi:protein-tyrosine phosphatase
MRDLGGWMTADGRQVRGGQVYRSGVLDRLTEVEREAFAGLGIRTVFDLRTRTECASQPDRLPHGIAYVWLDVLGAAPSTAPNKREDITVDPVKAAELLGDGKAERFYADSYRGIIDRPSARVAYGRLFTSIAEGGTRPALFHCTTGKDRTGWAAAALLALLGVSAEDVMRDYLLTNEHLLPSVQPIFDRFSAAGGDPQLLEPAFLVRADYLNGALDEMRARYGSIESYFADGLGIEAALQHRLRAALTTGRL